MSSPQLSTGIYKPCKTLGSVTVQAFPSPIDIATQVIIDDVQIQSVAHVTAFQAGQCLLQAPPLDSDIDEATKKNLALCLSTPPDYPVRNNILRKNDTIQLRRRRSEGHTEEQGNTDIDIIMTTNRT